jgi:hypothetical protein
VAFKALKTASIVLNRPLQVGLKVGGVWARGIVVSYFWASRGKWTRRNLVGVVGIRANRDLFSYFLHALDGKLCPWISNQLRIIESPMFFPFPTWTLTRVARTLRLSLKGCKFPFYIYCWECFCENL